MKFGKLEIDPSINPAVLNTATWDPDGAWRTVSKIDDWQALPDMDTHCTYKEMKAPVKYAASRASCMGSTYFLVGLKDAQHVFIEMSGDISKGILGKPCFTKSVSGNKRVAMYKTDADIVHKYIEEIKPEKGPKALGSLPRLGVGVRISTSVWPAVWSAVDRCGFSANVIQNSLRELNLLEDLTAGLPARINYLFNFGTIAEGHTGSTFEGLWTYGVLDALKNVSSPRYGADADHIMVKRGDKDLRRAKKIIEAAKYYSFFTLDVSDVVDYAALENGSKFETNESLETRFEKTTERKQFLAYHGKPGRIAGRVYRLDDSHIGRLTGKYWRAFDAVQELHTHIRNLKNGKPFDLELSIDETPPDVDTCESVTTELELLFIIHELGRRRIPVSHIAPNFGVEKGVDYRCPDGLEGLGNRVRDMSRIAREHGVLLDCHSGDDLSRAARRTIGRASEGAVHFKISPSLQVIFAEVLQEIHPDIFTIWWDDTLSYARREAERGSHMAIHCIRDYERRKNEPPSPRHPVFHGYNFATVGKRDAGRFMFRDMFYDLSPAFYGEYQERIKGFLCTIAEDLFGS